MLAIAPTPAAGRALSRSRLVSVLRKADRQRNLQTRAEEISTALRAEHLGLTEALTEAYGISVRSLVAVLTAMVARTAALEGEVERCFGQHPDAEIITSQPGLGVVLGARVLAEFGDDKDRYADAKARRNYAGTSPITKTSGKSNARFTTTTEHVARPTIKRSARRGQPPVPARGRGRGRRGPRGRSTA